MPTVARKYQLQQSLIYHVYNRSHRGEYIFGQPEDFERFMTLLKDYRTRFNIKFYHWVIMSNHYHLSLWLEEPERISGIIAGLQRAYTHYYSRQRKVRGYLWQGRFRSQPIERDRYLIACGRYIERNPVRAGMVESAERYLYSSSRYYCLGEEDRITEEEPCYCDFGQNAESRRSGYREFLTAFDPEEDARFRDLSKPVGEKAFIAKLVRDGYNFVSRRRGRPRKFIYNPLRINNFYKTSSSKTCKFPALR